MPRPPRAETASTRIIGFRLTDDEEQRLDELVAKQGHKDRSALLRAWLSQAGPTANTAAAPNERTAPDPASTSPSPSLVEELCAALRREERHGLIYLPNAIRTLHPPVALGLLHASLLALAERGTLELRPESGAEFLSPNDAALCPRGPRDTVLSYARWVKDAGRKSRRPTKEDERIVIDAIRQISAREPTSSLLSLRKIRARQTLSKERFDAAVLRLSVGGVVVLHHHDFPESLAAPEREGLVLDANGTHYVGLALGRRWPG